MLRPMTAKRLLSVEVDALARGFWGGDWGGQVERLTGVSRYALHRLRVAARAGREHPQAAWVMARLHGVLRAGLGETLRSRGTWKGEAAKMAKMNWVSAKGTGKPRDAAAPRGGEAKGGWTHLKQAPVKRYTKAEIAALMKDRKH
jgi:hypothetical protein